MTAEDMLALYVSLLNLSLKVYPDKLEYVDQVFNNTTTLLAKLKEDGYVVRQPPKSVHNADLLSPRSSPFSHTSLSLPSSSPALTTRARSA
jgi:vacuolar protein sorting-associated protein 35